METIKYCEFAKMNSGTIREINIAVSKESPYNIGKSKKLTGIGVTATGLMNLGEKTALARINVTDGDLLVKAL
jgi:hypothetical protein